MNQGVTARKGDVMVLVGTRKGGFILSSDPSRKSWSLYGPHVAGGDVYHMIYDARGDGIILAAINSLVWGPHIEWSRDLGKSWQIAFEQPRFSGETSLSLINVWHIQTGRTDESGVLYAGVEPAALFRSDDGGNSWAEVTGLTAHPSRDRWQPGKGGLCLHSMVLDPTNVNRMWVGISAAGVFGTSDGGVTWETLNTGVRADFLPERYPEFGQCVHKMLAHPARPETLVQQNHCGVYRSDSGGAEWQDITEGLPSRFGLPLGLHPNDPDTMWVIPEDTALGDQVGGAVRYVSDAMFRVYRSRNGGADWQPMTRGLPQKHAYTHVMREGIAVDDIDPCGVYVGTTSGQIF